MVHRLGDLIKHSEMAVIVPSASLTQMLDLPIPVTSYSTDASSTSRNAIGRIEDTPAGTTSPPALAHTSADR